ASRRPGSFSGSLSSEGQRLALYLGRPDPVGVRGMSFPKFSADPGEVEVITEREGLEVFDYRIVRNQGQSNEKFLRIPCVVAPIDAWCPLLSVSRTGLGSAPASLGLRKVDFESGMFNEGFEVACDDARFAHAFIDQRLMEWLLLLPTGWGVQTHRDRLLVFGREGERAMQFQPVIDLAGDLVSRVPPSLSSLYPRLT
ncbi:MAG: hypothetical protein MUP92_02525, partial [Actinobacteria bacterium]|nr:hypothetical protein [Actinomycetota bacterium]